MNNRYLFRGMRTSDGEFVVGGYSYCEKDETHFIVCMGKDEISHIGLHEPVHAASIGQCTGLTDKNGKLIFEGDIISYNGSAEVVYFDTSINIPCFTTGIGSGSSTKPHPYKISKRHEVIGNIHENPELLQ